MSLHRFALVISVLVFVLPVLGALLLDRPKDVSIDVAKETNGDLISDEVSFFLVDPDPYEESNLLQR